jgi:hypothetical protein
MASGTVSAKDKQKNDNSLCLIEICMALIKQIDSQN